MSENNGWIKCSERLPETFTGFDLLVRSSPVLVYGKYTSGEKNKIFGAQIFGNKWYSADGECGEITHWQPFPQPPEEQIMAKYLYRYALESNNPTNNDDGNTWEDESRCFDNVALHIAKENAYAWDMFEEPEREVMYVWRDGDFENRLRFLAKFEVIQRLDVIELDKDDDPNDF